LLILLPATLAFAAAGYSVDGPEKIHKESEAPYDYQKPLHDLPDKSPLKPEGREYMDLNKNG